MFDQLVSLGWGAASLTRETAEKTLEHLYRRGELRRDEVNKLLKTLSERGEREKAFFKEHLSQKINEALQREKLVTRSEFNDLQQRVEILEQKIQQPQEEKSKEESEQ